MENPSVEFGKMNKVIDPYETVRKSFRVPVEKVQKVWVRIHSKRYPVIDICFDGVRILIDKEFEFTVGQSVLGCELNIFDVSIEGLDGRIIHISTGEDKTLQSGIQWMSVSETEAKKIFEIVSKMKKQFLTGHDISNDVP